MSNAVHRTEKAETLASVAAAYFALARPDGRHDAQSTARVIAAIRDATSEASEPPLKVGDEEPLPEGTTLLIPTLRGFNRVVLGASEPLLAALARVGFDHARKLLRCAPEDVIQRISPLPPSESRATVARTWTLTAFLNLDGMDRYTAEHLYDAGGIQSLDALAATPRQQLDKILAALVAEHARPHELAEQRHAERWPLEAKVLTRKRVSEVAKARAQMFRTPFAPARAATRADFYDAAARDASRPTAEAALAHQLGLLYRFQEAVLRGHLSLLSGRWQAAADAYQQARGQWHRLAEDVGATANVDDRDGINLDTATETSRRLLHDLPADEGDPLGAPVTELRDRRTRTDFRLGGFRFDELHQGSRQELQASLASRKVHELPGKVREAVQRAVLNLTRAELTRADARLVEGLIPGAGTTLMRDLEAQDREVLRRNLGSVSVGTLYASVPDEGTPSRKDGSGEVVAPAAARDGLAVLQEVASELSLGDVEPLVAGLWKGKTVPALLSDQAQAQYPEALLDHPDVTVFTKFVVLPGAGGAERFVPLTASFASVYEREVLAPRLTSADGHDAAFDDACWATAGAFAAIAPYVYGVMIPLGLRQAYACAGRRDLANRYGGVRASVYTTDLAVHQDLSSQVATGVEFDLDLYACSTHWINPDTVEFETAFYLLDIHEYAAWYIEMADQAYRRDERAAARSWYADVMCAIETYWGDNGLALQAHTAIQGVRNTIAAIADGQEQVSLHSLSTFNVTLGSGGDTGHVLHDRFLVVGRGPARPPGSQRPAGQRTRTTTGFPAAGGVPRVDLERVDVELDRTLVGSAMRIGNYDILIEHLGPSTEVYAHYLYCTAKLAAIDAGINWYGFPDYYVPPWSFQHLYGLARDLCNRALDAERNTFALLQTLEAAEKEVLQASQTLEMADAALALADTRVTQQEAANELAWTQAAIAFNQAGLAETENSEQGTVNLLTGVVSFLMFNPGPFFSGTVSLANDVLYEGLTGLAHTAWQQTEELNEAALAVAVAERDVAELGQQQARDYLAFLDSQTLDVGAYDYLLALSRQVTATYLEHSNRLAWLAQRALSHETRQAYKMVGLSYATDEELMDLTQAQRLTADLESMLATYTAGQTRRHQEIKWTVALSQLSPGALQSLRTTGTGAFVLAQSTLDWFFPGHYLHSLKDIGMAVVGTVPPTGVRGVLLSSGVSWVRVPNDGSYEDGSDLRDDWPTAPLADPTHASTPAFDGYDAYTMKMIQGAGSSVSLSQFDVQKDRAVLSLPQGMLSSVQHLGLDTAWTLQLHRQANAFDFAQIQDIELTFWLQAAFDDTLAQAQYEALVRQGRRGELEAAALVSVATDHPDLWAAFTGDTASADTLDLRLLALDVGGLPQWEAARRISNILVACARGTATDELTLRLCCDHDPVGHRFTTTDGAVLSRVDRRARSTDPHADPGFTAWVKETFYDSGEPGADPVVRWVLKAAPRHIGTGWLAQDADGLPVVTASGALRGVAKEDATVSAMFIDGTGWSDVCLKVRVRHLGATLRLRIRDNGAEHYAVEIDPAAVALLHVARGSATTLASRALAYPDDEFLLVEFGVVDHALRLRVDGITVFEQVAGGGSVATGSVGLDVLNRGAPGVVTAEFDDVEVVRLSKLWAEAETLLNQPFTGALPADWSFASPEHWSIDPGGHRRLDLRLLANLTLKLDYRFEMAEQGS